MFQKLILMSVILAALGCRSTGTNTASQPILKPEDVPFQLRAYQTEKLKNGLTLLWIPDASLPYVSLQLMLKSGSAQDPAGKEGLASFTAEMLDHGTKSRTAPKIAEALESIGADFGVEVTADYMVAGASSLSFNRDQMLALFNEIILQPSFPNEEIERERKNLSAGLHKIADKPDRFSEFILPNFVFGSKHGYGHPSSGTLRSVKSFTRADLVNFYADQFTPDNAVLAIVGQYDDAFKSSLSKTFEAWSGQSKNRLAIGEFPQWSGTEVLLVDRPDLKQAQVHIVVKGVTRDAPEYLDVRAATKILGESFGSRLFEEIRSKRGLTYGIYSRFEPREKPAMLGIYTYTRLDKLDETVRETLNVYRKFIKDGVTPAEVAIIKEQTRGQFPLIIETPEALARQMLILERYGISVDYLKDFFRNTEGMTQASINAAITKYFSPENIRILIYAPKAVAEPVLKPLGKLEIKDYRSYLQ